jgi:hypothetical protein
MVMDLKNSLLLPCSRNVRYGDYVMSIRCSANIPSINLHQLRRYNDQHSRKMSTKLELDYDFSTRALGCCAYPVQSLLKQECTTNKKEIAIMVNFAPKRTESTNTSQLQVDPTAAKSTSECHPPCILAGTSQGLCVLDAERRIDLEGHSITALASSQGTEKTELWAITDYKTVWHRSTEGKWLAVGSSNQHRLHGCVAKTLK